MSKLVVLNSLKRIIFLFFTSTIFNAYSQNDISKKITFHFTNNLLNSVVLSQEADFEISDVSCNLILQFKSITGYAFKRDVTISGKVFYHFDKVDNTYGIAFVVDDQPRTKINLQSIVCTSKYNHENFEFLLEELEKRGILIDIE